MNIDLSAIVPILKDLGILIGAGVWRSVTGWYPKAMADGRIVRFEYKQLIQTCIKVGSMGVVAYFGLAFAGIDNAAVISAASAFFADKILDAISSKKK